MSRARPSSSLRTIVSGLVLALVTSACGPSATPDSSATTAAPSESPSAASTSAGSTPSTTGATGPSGVVAIGHSGLTGEGAGGPAFSWATGSDPSVNSIWARLSAADPDLAGVAVNRAQAGAHSSTLLAQARQALADVPTPALVIISTIDGDILCNGSDADHVPELGANVKAALEAVTSASPETRIVVVGQFGRPSVPFIEQLIAEEPRLVPAFKEGGECAFLDAEGRPIPENVATLISIIEAYEAEQARVCADVPQCATDGGVRAAYVDRLENFAADFAHLNARGQAAQAELMWPVVREVLGR